jgi:hypothetical protein
VFVYPCCKLLLNYHTNFVIYSWRYRDVSFDERGVGNNWDVNRREEIGAKASSFGVIPCEHCILLTHKIMHEIEFCRPKKVFMFLVEGITAIARIASCGNEG